MRAAPDRRASTADLRRPCRVDGDVVAGVAQDRDDPADALTVRPAARIHAESMRQRVYQVEQRTMSDVSQPVDSRAGLALLSAASAGNACTMSPERAEPDDQVRRRRDVLNACGTL